MTLELQCDEDFPLTYEQCVQLLRLVCEELQIESEGHITVRCVPIHEITNMNSTYRHKDAPTNILTFSYDENEHDLALCIEVAKKEAIDRNILITDYVALLLVHGFLHALGMDHEKSDEEAHQTELAEKKVLEASGFTPVTLFSV